MDAEVEAEAGALAARLPPPPSPPAAYRLAAEALRAATGAVVDPRDHDQLWRRLQRARRESDDPRLVDAAVALRAARHHDAVESLRRLDAGLAPLWGQRDAGRLLSTAARQACVASGLDRAIVFSVDGQRLWTESVHLHDEAYDADFTAFARRHPPPLDMTVLETDIVRRGAPRLVHRPEEDSRAYLPIVAAVATFSYLVAPLVIAGRVVGTVHADAYTSGRVVDALDQAALAVVAQLLAAALERVELRSRLVSAASLAERHRTALGRLLDEPTRLPVAAEPLADGARPPVGSLQRLTPREREVLGLLASGATNAEIARRLLVSVTTVKSHVRQVLRKLDAPNRTVAVARAPEVLHER